MKKINYIFRKSFFAFVILFFTTFFGNQFSIVSPVLEQKDSHSLSKKGLSIFYHAYSPQESRQNLGQDIISKGYAPIQISIQNNTSRSWRLNSLTLETLSPKKIINYFSKQMFLRSAGFKIVSLLFWPFIIPDTVHSLASLYLHHSLKKELLSRALNFNEIIPPYAVIHRLVYVKASEESELPSFSLSLTDTNYSRKVSFHI
jgi:hypothetical protein